MRRLAGFPIRHSPSTDTLNAEQAATVAVVRA
ncbi:hypothetical protein SAMN05192568_101742 [Methylobacterium pseudosasicola]|uniref:Uncharacterized protein n=1 Tax=Methylobacterium pseudosasicola TaxID=582667 RepID=A0A1I4MKM3_9HYPH|nr:hypothetical protein SAMN05192568_101742 [Methylobacterium pseudosasicola]